MQKAPLSFFLAPPSSSTVTAQTEAHQNPRSGWFDRFFWNNGSLDRSECSKRTTLWLRVSLGEERECTAAKETGQLDRCEHHSKNRMRHNNRFSLFTAIVGSQNHNWKEKFDELCFTNMHVSNTTCTVIVPFLVMVWYIPIKATLLSRS